MKPAFSRSRSRSGFALPAVLAVTGVVTLIFLVAITALAGLNAEARAARERVRFLQRALTAEATITYIAATEPFSPRGMDVGDLRRVSEFLGLSPTFSTGVTPASLRLDNRSYLMDQTDASLIVQLQDQAGMVNVSRLDAPGMARLANAAGIRPAAARDTWSRYLDYVDSDDSERPGGSERLAYSNGGPANRQLLTGAEWLSILGAREAIDPVKWRALRDDVVADQTEAAANVNTASLAALEISFGFSPAQADAVIRAREQRPILSIEDLVVITGAPPIGDPLAIYTYPSGRIVFTVRDTRSPWVYRGRVSLTPGDQDQPFWIDQTETFEGPGRTRADASDAPAFPYPAS